MVADRRFPGVWESNHAAVFSHHRTITPDEVYAAVYGDEALARARAAERDDRARRRDAAYRQLEAIDREEQAGLLPRISRDPGWKLEFSDGQRSVFARTARSA